MTRAEWVAELPTEFGNEFLLPHPTTARIYGLASPGHAMAAETHPASGVLHGVETFRCSGDAHLELSADGNWAIVCCYAAGEVEVLRVLAGGELGSPVDSKVVANRLHQYAAELADRQESAHPHQALLDPTNKWCLVSDLGSDVVWVYAFDTRAGTLTGASSDARHLRLPQGAGPRHLDFHPSGDFVYVNCELTGDVMAARFDSRGTGKLTAVQTVGALPAGVPCSREGSRGNADIHCSADGRFVFVTTRTDHAVVTFGVDAATGELGLLHRTPSGGLTPRHFSLDPSGVFLRVVNQDGVDGREGEDTGCVVTFRIGVDGKLTDPRTQLVGGCPAVITAPVCPASGGDESPRRGRI
eukprot:SAG22_NODE_29_length_28404_cov_23.294153_6_plen_356_part_00